MDHDNASGAVSRGRVGCRHNSCDLNLILPLTSEERYNIMYGGREGPTAPAIRSRQTASGCVTYRTRQLIYRVRLMENCLAYRVVTYRERQLIFRARLMGNSNCQAQRLYYLPPAAINMPRAAYGNSNRHAQRLYYLPRAAVNMPRAAYGKLKRTRLCTAKPRPDFNPKLT